MNGDIGWTKYSNWLERLAKYLSQDVDMDLLVKSFTEFSNNEDRVRFCFSDNTKILRNRMGKFCEEEYPALPIEPDVIEAKKFCQQAASELNQRKFEEAAEYYTEALKCCVHWKSSSHVPNLGTMFANRSLCYFNLQAYKNSLDDIEFAFMFKCPDSVKETLQIRKLKCLVSLGNRLEAQNYLENYIKTESPLLVDQALSVLSKCVKLDDEPDSENALSEDFGAGFFECASSKMELKSEPNKGRFVVANREVQIGEVLFQEKPLAVVPHCFQTTCASCCSTLEEEYPDFSTGLLFCSLSCYQKCKLVGCTVNPSIGKVYVDIGIAFLPLQVVLLHGIENVIRDYTENKQSTHTSKAGSNYASLLTLCTHEEKYSSQENVNFALTAIFLVIVMNQIHPLEGEQLLICAEVLLKHIQQLSTNSISVVQQNLVQGLSNQSAEEDVGVAIYPNISFLNHSCQPNVVPIFEGSKLTLQASRTIKMGEEISFCYGPSVATMTRKDRMAHLRKQYFFDCSCYACENAIESHDNALLCPSCSGPMVYNLDFTSNCLNCKYEEQDVSEIVNRSSKLNLIAAEGAALMEKDDLEEAISKISQAHNEMDKLLHRHNLQLIQVKENLCKCLALMGHYEMAYKYSMFNLRTQEIINGPESMQVAFEFQKACKLRWNFIEELVEDSDSQRALEHANGLLLLLERLLSLFTKLNESLKENSQIIDSDLGFTNQIVNLTDIKSKVLSLIESL